MGNLIRIGEPLEFHPKCWEMRHWLRRRSPLRAVLAWVLVAVVLGVLEQQTGALRTWVKYR